MKIVYGADAQDTVARVARADAVHERAARGTEVVGHGVARGDGTRLAKSFQVVAAAHVLEVGVGDGEVRCEHGRGDFAAIPAVADEAIYQTGALSWLVIGKRRARISGYERIEGKAGKGARRQVSSTDEEIGMPDLRIPVARRHRSTWLLLHLPSTSRHWLDRPEGSRVWIGQ